MDDHEVLKMLFEEHHRQLAAARLKIHTTAERTLALLTIIAGWLVISDKPLIGGLQWILIVAITLITFGACSIIYRNNSKYYKVAKVMPKINTALGLFEPNKFYPNESIYPESWKTFGEKGIFWGVFTHYIMIIAVAILCIIASILKA